MALGILAGANSIHHFEEGCPLCCSKGVPRQIRGVACDLVCVGDKLKHKKRCHLGRLRKRAVGCPAKDATAVFLQFPV